MRKYSVQFKITVAEAYLNGDDGFRKVAARHMVDCSLLRRWVATYQARGSAGFQPQGRHYSAAFKLSVVKCVHEECLSHREAATRFGLGRSSQVGIWQRQYYSGGVAALCAPKRRRPITMPVKPSVLPGSSSVHDDAKSREQLKAELEYLRMENAYLKKLEEVRETSSPNKRPGKKRSS